MIKISDESVREKIAEVEGQEWLNQDAWSERDGSKIAEDTSVAHARKLWEKRRPLRISQDPDHSTVYGAVIYGHGGWHRYFVTHSGEVVYSESHGRSSVKKAEAVGFRIWR